MKSARKFTVAVLLAAPVLGASVARTQEASFDAREQNFRAYAALRRADVKAERKDIINAIMQFSDTDAAKFWPIFQQHDAEQQPASLPARR